MRSCTLSESGLDFCSPCRRGYETMKLACLRRRMLAKSTPRSSCRAARLSAVGSAGFVVASMVLVAAPLRAASYSWAVAAGDWSVASNWGGTLPGSSDTAYVVNGGTVSITQPGETCNSLYVGYYWGNDGTVQMTFRRAQRIRSGAWRRRHRDVSFERRHR